MYIDYNQSPDKLDLLLNINSSVSNDTAKILRDLYDKRVFVNREIDRVG